MTEEERVTLTETRYMGLVDAENRLKEILEAHPELARDEKLTSTAKRYKTAFEAFVTRVDEVLSSDALAGVFTMAAVHGMQYKGPSLAKDIVAAKALLKLK